LVLKGRTMTSSMNPVPYETARVVEAIQHALGEVPEIHRKAALKHASETVQRQLIEQSEQAKTASREAGPDSQAKSDAAIQTIRQMTDNPGPSLADRVKSLEAQMMALQRLIQAGGRSEGSRGVDPGDSVPEGVAPMDPVPLDRQAEAALEHLQKNLGAP
jgi:hypothetical protein